MSRETEQQQSETEIVCNNIIRRIKILIPCKCALPSDPYSKGFTAGYNLAMKHALDTIESELKML